jgi:hypothetical protein
MRQYRRRLARLVGSVRAQTLPPQIIQLHDDIDHIVDVVRTLVECGAAELQFDDQGIAVLRYINHNETV